MKSFFIVLYLTLIDEKDILKIVSIVAAAIGGGIVKVILENKQKKLTIWQALASIFIAIMASYGAYPLIVEYLPESFTIAAIVVVALLSENIFKYVLINSNDFIKALFNKIWGTVSK